MSRSRSLLALLAFVVAIAALSAAVSVDARKQQAKAQKPPPKAQNQQQQQQQQQQQPQRFDDGLPDEVPTEKLLDEPVQGLAAIEAFQHSVMETTLPVFLFIGNSKKTPFELRRNLTLAARAMQAHIVSFYMDTVTAAGRAFLQQAGLGQHPASEHIMLFNPEFVRQGDAGGFAKNPALYSGRTTPYATARWFIAMSSRKHIDYITDLSDLAAWKKKFPSSSSLPKVLLLTSANFTSPTFVSVSHQFRFLAQFGVVQGISREAYDRAMAEMSKEEQEMKKVKDIGVDAGSASAAADAAAGAAAAVKRTLSSSSAFSTVFDQADEILLASTFAPTANNAASKAGTTAAQQAAERRDAKHKELLKVFGCKDVPAIVTLSGDLSDAEVYAANNMSIARLQEIVRDHALPIEQLQQLFAKSLQAEFELEQQLTKEGRVQKRDAAKFKKLADESDDAAAASTASSSGSGASADDEDGLGSSKKGGDSAGDDADDEKLANFLPVWVNDTKQWTQHCPFKAHASASGSTLCIAAFTEAVLDNVVKYDAKVEELAKGVRKIQKQNRLGYKKVRLFLWELPQHVEMARFLDAGPESGSGVLPSVVYVNPVKGSYYNHEGKFTGSSMAEFVLGKMSRRAGAPGAAKAKTYKMRNFVRFFPEVEEAEKRREQQKAAWEEKERQRKERIERKKREEAEAAERRAEAERRKNDVEEEVVHEE
jgi:hypothetical protein